MSINSNLLIRGNMKNTNLLGCTAIVLVALSCNIANATDIYSKHTVVNTSLPVSGTLDVLSITVPAGTWKVTSKAVVINFASPDFVRCGINYAPTKTANFTQLDASTVYGSVAQVLTTMRVVNLNKNTDIH